MKLLFCIYCSTFLSCATAEGYTEIYFDDDKSLSKINVKSGIQTELSIFKEYIVDILVDARQNKIYLSFEDNNVKSFKIDGTSLTDVRRLITEDYSDDWVKFGFIVHDHLYYAFEEHIKKVKLDIRKPKLETVKTFKRAITELKLYTDMDDTNWIFILIDQTVLVKCTLDGLHCVNVIYSTMYISTFTFYELQMVVCYMYTPIQFNNKMMMFHLNGSIVGEIRHSFGHVYDMHIHGQSLFYYSNSKISVFDLKKEDSRVIHKLKLSDVPNVMDIIDNGIETSYDNEQTHNSSEYSMVSQSTWSHVEADSSTSQSTRESTIKQYRPTTDLEEAPISTDNTQNIKETTKANILKHGKAGGSIGFNETVWIVAGTVMFIGFISSVYVAYRCYFKTRRARNVQWMTPRN